MSVWLYVIVCGRRLSLRPIGCKPALSVTQKRRCSCDMRRVALYKCYMPLPSAISTLVNLIVSGIDFSGQQDKELPTDRVFD